MSETELERDLALLPLCGLPPYTADRLIDVTMIDGEVEIRLAEYFERPLRLTPAEGVALLAAGRALLSVPGSDDGRTARDRARHARARARRQGPHHRRRRHRPTTSSGCKQAALDHERLELDYYSFARDEMTTRVIDPWRVFHAFGSWYVAAWCHRADAERLFRVDRVRAVRADRRALRPGRSRRAQRCRRPTTPCTGLAPAIPRVTLRLAPEASWVVESYPHERAKQRRDGGWDVVLAVSEPAWLERLLLSSVRQRP